MKYGEWLDEWLNTCVKPLVKKRTLDKYQWVAHRKLTPALGSYELSALTAPVLQKFTADISLQYAPSTVSGIVIVIDSSLKCAVKLGLLQEQHASNILRPKVEQQTIQCFTKQEQKKLETFIAHSPKSCKYVGILLCLYTGLRVGELLALTWDDIDFKRNLLTVSKSCHDTWTQNGYCKMIEKPKTAHSVRLIPIPKQLMVFIKQAKKQSASEYIIGGKKPISVRAYQRSFEMILKRLGLAHRGFHSLRHTFATRALESGMDVKTLSELLGHKNSAITLNRYAHSLMEHKRSVMNKLGKLLQ